MKLTICFFLQPVGLAEMYLTQAAVGGLSITASLSDFSVYIFHPYGGKKAGSSGALHFFKEVFTH